MTTPEIEDKKPAFRKIIDWNKVGEFLESGCPSTKIADAFGISTDTLYRRCEEELKTSYTAFSQQKKSTGEALVHKAQFDKAIGRTELGDNTLLIWLGKVRCDQKESVELSVAPETAKAFGALMNQTDVLQENGGYKAYAAAKEAKEKKPATEALHLKCNKCDLTDFVLKEDAKDWKCPRCKIEAADLPEDFGKLQ